MVKKKGVKFYVTAVKHHVSTNQNPDLRAYVIPVYRPLIRSLVLSPINYDYQSKCLHSNYKRRQ
jgi:hypothetical protein